MSIKRYADAREQRKVRMRFGLKGTPERPRMSVFRSAKHIYAQVIDDESGTTLAAASSVETAVRSMEGSKTAIAETVGRLCAERALAKGVTKLVFDRNGFHYTGRIAAVSKAAHELGLLSKEGHTGSTAAAPQEQ
ncbi:MAG: 50S ribosomal protein L18 [Deltaproteobacteria bacterium]|nr:50S ribosomal protein L18 [Deltaproteobacteria bacterium]